VAPAKAGQVGQVVIPEHATPAKQGQKELPGQVLVPKHVAPAKPGQPAKVIVPEHVAPARPGQKEKPGQIAGPERVASEKAGPQEDKRNQLEPPSKGQSKR